MTPAITVVICTHNPHSQRLERTLHGLGIQTLEREQWELLVIDNASPDGDFFTSLDLSWQPQARVLHEPQLGLTYARLTGFAAAAGPILVFVDDDNVLAPDYLVETLAAFEREPRLGVIGGKSIPEWESPPQDWVSEFGGCLALRDLGDQELTANSADGRYPDFAPLGAGMALRMDAASEYVRTIKADQRPTVTGRKGKDLTSGEDNDIVLTLLRAGWQVGYRPQLRLTHLIPSGRTTQEYLARLNYASSRSWVQVLDRHGIRPWPPISQWTLLPRKLRAYWRCRAWRHPAGYVRWRGACGTFEGRAALSR